MRLKSFVVVRSLPAALVLALSLPMLAALPVREAVAQERRTILDLFFGSRAKQERYYDDPQLYEPAPVQRRVMPSDQYLPDQEPRLRKARQKTVPPVVEEKPVVVEKSPDAKKVLVVGDFVAGSLGDGLKTAFEGTPGIVIETRANGSSGMVRKDYFDWPENLDAYLDAVEPSLVIVSLGANDRQQMTIGTAKEKFRSDVWMAEYTNRVRAFATAAQSRKTPLLWVGMPSFQSSAMTADMVTFNSVFRTETEEAGGQFIDIWDGFVDESGKFVLTGSDINGQQVRLRGADGINLTKAGKRKLAFYVEKDIRRLLGDAAASGSDVPGAGGLRDLVVAMPAANEDILETQPISLSDPELDGGATLLGGLSPSPATGKSPRDLLVEQGKVAQAPAGRVDDFRLSKPETVISNPVIRN